MLPTRNGNDLVLPTRPFCCWKDTDPTYKEWKPLRRIGITGGQANTHGSYLQGMETMSLLVAITNTWDDTDPTYKEWKHAEGTALDLTWFQTIHGSYLQGMETLIILLPMLLPMSLHGSYLQGMETRLLVNRLKVRYL